MRARWTSAVLNTTSPPSGARPLLSVLPCSVLAPWLLLTLCVSRYSSECCAAISVRRCCGAREARSVTRAALAQENVATLRPAASGP